MKKVLISLIQIAVTIAVLFWVFHDPQKRAQMAVALRMANYGWVVAGIACYCLVEFVAAIRWFILLRVQRIYLSVSRVSGLFLIGMFYNQLLPGGTGGDRKGFDVDPLRQGACSRRGETNGGAS